MEEVRSLTVEEVSPHGVVASGVSLHILFFLLLPMIPGLPSCGVYIGVATNAGLPRLPPESVVTSYYNLYSSSLFPCMDYRDRSVYCVFGRGLRPGVVLPPPYLHHVNNRASSRTRSVRSAPS